MFAGLTKKQTTARRILLNQLEREQLSHAYLFVGPPGAGKRAAARSFANAINCPQRIKACACPDCPVDQWGQHPDLQVISPAGSSIKLQQVKDAVASAALSPNQGRYRIFIIEEADRLTREAANALLLTLEEPGAAVIFILTASKPVMETIESRCQVVLFHQTETAEQRQESTAVANQSLMRSLVLKAAQTAPADRSKILEEIEAIDDGPSLFLATILDVLRDLLVLAAGGSSVLLSDRAFAEQLRPHFSRDAAKLAERCQLVVSAERMLQENVNRRLLCDHLLFSL